MAAAGAAWAVGRPLDWGDLGAQAAGPVPAGAAQRVAGGRPGARTTCSWNASSWSAALWRALFTTSDGTPERAPAVVVKTSEAARAVIRRVGRRRPGRPCPPEPKPAPVVAETMEATSSRVHAPGWQSRGVNLPDFATRARLHWAAHPGEADTDQKDLPAPRRLQALKRAEGCADRWRDAALGEMVDFEAMRRQVRLKDWPAPRG